MSWYKKDPRKYLYPAAGLLIVAAGVFLIASGRDKNPISALAELISIYLGYTLIRRTGGKKRPSFRRRRPARISRDVPPSRRRWFVLPTKKSIHTTMVASGDSGHPAAAYFLGREYYEGRGVEKDLDKAITFWRQSAEKNYAPAQYALGANFRAQIGDEESDRWIRKAAENNFPRAQIVLGLLAFFGFQKNRRDRAESYKWMALASRKEPSLGTHVNRLIFALFTSRSDRLEGRRRAEEWIDEHKASSG